MMTEAAAKLEGYTSKLTRVVCTLMEGVQFVGERDLGRPGAIRPQRHEHDQDAHGLRRPEGRPP